MERDYYCGDGMEFIHTYLTGHLDIFLYLLLNFLSVSDRLSLFYRT
jgi:hypothetical protein